MPVYLERGTVELRRRAARARGRLRRCAMCPRRCKVDRLAGELGECRTGALARVEGACAHFGEERPLIGRGGSGTIFFAGCNVHCVFCQNAGISHPVDDPPPSPRRDGAWGGTVPGGAASGGAAPNGATPGGAPAASAPAPAPGAPPVPPRLRWEVTSDRLARLMLDLQAAGCENINLVSPSHVVPQILEALAIAAADGLRLPLVYNTGGYDSIATLRLLDGVVDIYMPDMKYADDAVGRRLSGVPDYVCRNRAAVLEMHRQTGDLRIDERGVARRGLLVRHLVLPGDLAGTAEVARFLATEVSRDTYINVMDQYHPACDAARYPEIVCSLTAPDYRRAVEQTLAAGLWRLDA